MKNFFYLLIFLSFASVCEAKSTKSLNERCKIGIEPPHVKITSQIEPLRYNHTKVSATLARLREKEYGQSTDKNHDILGLATYSLGTTLDFQIAKKTFKDGVTCFYPVNAELQIVMKNPTIYIAKNLRKGTCAYNVSLRHEQTHQQINIEVVEHYIPIMRDRFVEAVRKHPVASRPKDDVSIEAAQESLKKRYMEAIKPLVDEIKNEAMAEHMKLDNEENYAFEQNLCR